MGLLREPGSNGRTALDQILEGLGTHGLWIVLAAEDSAYEDYLAWTAARRDNFTFFIGYSETGPGSVFETITSNRRQTYCL